MNDLLIDRFRKAGINIDSVNRLKPFWNRTTCQKCNEQKPSKALDMSFNMTTGGFICHKCQHKGSVLYEKKAEYSKPKYQVYEPSDEVKTYFFGRGITEKVFNTLVERKLLSYSKSGAGFYFNYWRNGELINYKARTIADKKFYQHQDAEKILFNIDSAKGKTKAILVEGEMSVFACIEAGLESEYAILSLENGANKEGNIDGKLTGLRNCYEQLSEIETWIVALDNDQAGVYTADHVIKYLGPHKCKIVAYPEGCKDPDDIINRNKRGNYTGHQNNEALREMMLTAVDFPVKGIIELDDKTKALLMQYKKFGRPPAIKIPMLENSFSFKRGDLTVLTGYANMGKSTWASNLAYLTLMEYQWKWAIYAGEQHPQDRYFEDLAHTILRKPIMDKDRYGNPIEGCATPDEYEAVLEFISNHVYLIYPERGQKPTFEWIKEKLAFLKSKHGINGVILDTFNKMKHDFANQRDDVYLDDWLDTCIEDALDYDAYILLMHPSKPQKTRNGTVIIMNMYDIHGGAMSANKVDNIMIYHREERFSDENSTPSTDAVIRLEKIRDQKTVGRIGNFKVTYDPFSNGFKYGPMGLRYNRTLDTVTHQIIKTAMSEIEAIAEEDIPF